MLGNYSLIIIIMVPFHLPQISIRKVLTKQGSKKKDPPISISMSAQNTTLKILFSSMLAFPRLYTVGHQWTVVSEGCCLIEFSG